MIREELVLPQIERPGYGYSSAYVHSGILWTSGLIPKIDGAIRARGIVGDTISLQQARDAATLCALQGLAIAADAAGGRSHVRAMFKSTCYVACTADFPDISEIAEAARFTMNDAFGEKIDYVRSTVGVMRLPANSPVMFDFAFLIQDVEADR